MVKPADISAAIAEWSEVEVPSGVLLYLLGTVERSTLNKYRMDNLLVPGKKPGYYKLASVHNVVGRFREMAAGRMGRTDDVDVTKSAAGLKDAQKRLAEIRAAKMSGDLISAPEIADAWREVALSVKQLFLSFPARARFDCPNLKPQDQKALEKLVREMLHECATEGTVRLPPTNK